MKKYLRFIVRLSIVNFLFFLFSIIFITQIEKNFLKDSALSNKVQNPASKTTLSKSQELNSTTDGQVQQDNSATIESSPAPRDLFSEVPTHNSKGNCWIIYSGHIYDITPFFGSHPGGDSIMLKYCGGDATLSFDSKEKSPPIPHSGNANSLLQQYLIQ